MQEDLWASGKFYRRDVYGAFSAEGHCLEFAGNNELRQRLQETRTLGALGDNYPKALVIDTPENRAAVEGAGLRPWASEAVIDDRLWKEGTPS